MNFGPGTLVPVDALAWSVLAAAVGVAVLHTALGPDHTLPFLALARARRWSLARTLGITAACGVGHVLSSLVLGLIGLGAGVAVGELEVAEANRGHLAVWLLIGFGLAYGLWGLRHALRAHRGLAVHRHGGHAHVHARGDEPHRHGRGPSSPSDVTVWALFAVFVLGPCEPLIPLFVLPASQGRWGLAAATAAVFGVATVATMVVLVGVAVRGLRGLSLGRLERWSHPLAGATLLATGLSVLVLGL